METGDTYCGFLLSFYSTKGVPHWPAVILKSREVFIEELSWSFNLGNFLEDVLIKSNFSLSCRVLLWPKRVRFLIWESLCFRICLIAGLLNYSSFKVEEFKFIFERLKSLRHNEGSLSDSFNWWVELVSEATNLGLNFLSLTQEESTDSD